MKHNLPYYILILSLCLVPLICTTNSIREIKLYACGVLILFMFSTSVYKGIYLSFNNISILILIPYLLLATYLIPGVQIPIYKFILINPWQFKVMFYVLLYFILFLLVRGAELDYEERKTVMWTMGIVGFGMSLYCLIQAVGLEQWFKPSEMTPDVSESIIQKHIVGTLGNPTLVAPFISMCIPLTRYKYWLWLSMVTAVIITGSVVGMVSMVLSTLVYLWFRHRVAFWYGAVFTLVLISAGVLLQNEYSLFLHDGGRRGLWIEVLKVWKNGPNFLDKAYPLTGVGLGSYRFLFSLHAIQSYAMFIQVHNEYLEWLFCTGIIGVLLLFCGGVQLFKKVSKCKGLHNKYDSELLILVVSFTSIALSAGGTFVWQLAPMALYTIVVLGLISALTDSNV